MRGKRLFDIAVSLVLLVLSAPLMLVTAIVIYSTMGRPIFFKQKRPGKDGTIFEMYKFRTMTDERDASGTLLPDEQRLTRIGRWIRAASLDELPQLINVVKGDMSLVGPRPLLPEYLPLYTERQYRRHEVRPGITGWAQVNGRNALNWEKRLEMDVWYVEHRSWKLDLKILALTILKIVRREGIRAEGYETMPKFTGTKK